MLQLQLGADREACLPLFLLRHLAALRAEATGHLLFQAIALPLDRCLPLLQGALETLELLLPAPEQRRSQRLGEFDFRLALRTLDGRLGDALAARLEGPRAHRHGDTPSNE